MTTDALLARLREAKLPLTLTDSASIQAARKLQILGLVDAAFKRPSKGRNDYGAVHTAVVKRLLR